jgi:4a-hydroxytetrahydrobiopterin dehydratase
MADVPVKLNDEEISERLRELPSWKVSEGKLTREFKFEDFLGAVDFVNRVARVAEDLGHHPDLFVTWGEVNVSLTSHSAGGITANDFQLAEAIDRL